MTAHTPTTLIKIFAVCAAYLFVLVACGDDGGADLNVGGAADDAMAAGDFGTGGFDVPEQPEIAYKFLTPRASRDYVFVPNETLDTVSKIDADSLEITSIQVCDRPTQLEAVEGLNRAVVLCQGSDEAAVLYADAIGPDNGLVDKVVYVDLDPRMNRLVISPDGRFAFAFFSYAAREDGEPDGDLQTVTMVHTEADAEAAFSLTVGFQVRGISFRVEGGGEEPLVATHAYIITDTGISVVELDQVDSDRRLPVIPVSPRLLDDPQDREVYVTPSGAYAVVRDLGAPELYIVQLADGAIQTIPMSASATDVDLVPVSGTPSPELDRAVVVVREGNVVLDIPVAAAFADPQRVEALDAGEAVKGLATIGGDGRFALLYTTLGGLDELTVVDMSGRLPTQVLEMRKPIRAAVVASDGRRALVLHPVSEPGGDATPAEILVAQYPAYSIVDLESGYTKMITTDVEPEEFAFWSGDVGSFAYLIFNDEDRGVARAEMVNLNRFTMERLPLASPPVDVGRITGRGRMWINQEHPVGRMTFVDVVTQAPSTVTGFELNRFTR